MTAIQINAALLNGWDYVLAIEIASLNQLRPTSAASGAEGSEASRPAYRGTLSLPDNRRLDLVLGYPSVASVDDAAKRVELSFAMKGSCLVHGEVQVHLPDDARLVLAARLGAVGVSLREAAAEGSSAPKGTTRHDLVLNLQTRNADLQVRLQDAAHDRLKPEIAESIRARLCEVDLARLPLASFELADSTRAYLPRYCEASLVRGAGKPGRDVLVVALSLDPQGSVQETRLDFSAAILPINVPAALWVGPDVALGKLLLPILAEALRHGDNRPPLTYDADHGQIVLADRFEIPQPANGNLPIVLDAFSVAADASTGSLAVRYRTHSDLHTFTIARGNTGALDSGWLQLHLTEDHRGVALAYKADKVLPEEAVLQQDPRTWGYCTDYYGILKFLIDKSAQYLNGQLAAAIAPLGNLLAPSALTSVNPPAPLLESVAVVDGGAVFVGIRCLTGR